MFFRFINALFNAAPVWELDKLIFVSAVFYWFDSVVTGWQTFFLSPSSRRRGTGDAVIVCERHRGCHAAHGGVSPRKAHTSGHLVLQGKPPAAVERSRSGECVPLPAPQTAVGAPCDTF